jgi:hypothetical protein
MVVLFTTACEEPSAPADGDKDRASAPNPGFAAFRA